MIPDSIEREILINAPIERLWSALTEAHHLGNWWADNGAEIDLRPGGAAVFHFSTHGDFHARVERVEPPTLFSYRWARRANEPPAPGASTLVTFTLSSESAGDRVTVVETGFASLDATEDERQSALAENTQGWIDELAELQSYLEGSPA